MGIGDSSVGLLFRIRADSSNAVAELQKFRQTLSTETEGAAEQGVSALNKLGGKLDSLGSTLTGFGTVLTAGITLPLIGIGATAIKTFADVELAVANISTIKPQINTSEVFSALNEISTRIPQTAAQLGDGLYNIFSSVNVTQSEGLNLLEQFSKGATAAQTDASTFGTAVLGVMNAYKLSVSDAAHISDVFFNTVNLGVVNGAELANQLGVVTQAAKGAGVSFEELGALIVGATKEGGPAAQNINNLANFLNKITETDARADIKKIFDVDLVDKATGKFKSLVDVLGEIKPKYDALSESAQKDALARIFPDAQAKQGARVLLSQLDAVKDALKINETAAGAAEEAYKKISVTASVQFALLKNSVVAILGELGSALLPLLQPIVNWVAQSLVPAISYAVEIFKSWSPATQTVIAALAVFSAALGPVLLALGAFVSFIAPLVGGLTSLATGIVTAGGVAAFLAPILATIGSVVTVVLIPALKIIIPLAIAIGAAFVAVATAGAVLYAAWQTNFGGLRDYTIKAYEVIKNTISQAMSFISEVTSSVGGGIVNWWRENYPLIRSTIETVSGQIQFYVQSFLAKIQEFWQNHGESIKTGVSTVWGAISSIVSFAADTISDVIKLALTVINGDWSKAWRDVQNSTQKATAYIVNALKNLGSAIVDYFKWLVQITVENLGYILSTVIGWGGKIVAGIIYILATLPDRIVELVPKFYNAGVDIANAIWKGFKEGITASGLTASVTFRTKNVDEKSQAESAAANAFAETIAKSKAAQNTDQTTSGAVGGGDAEKRAKEREELYKRDLAAQISILKSQLEDAEKLYTDTLETLREKFKETKDKGAFELGIVDAAKLFNDEVKAILPSLVGIENQQAEADKKTDTEKKALAGEQERRRKEGVARQLAEIKKNSELTREIEKKSSDDSVKNAEEASNRRIEVTQKETATNIKAQEQKLALGIINEVEYAEEVARLKLKALTDEKAEIEALEQNEETKHRLKILGEDIKQQEIENTNSIREAVEKLTTAYENLNAKRAEHIGSAPGEVIVGSGEGIGGIDGSGGGFLSDIIGGLGTSIAEILEPVDILNTLGGMLASTFGQVAQAVGNAVKSFVLFGSAGGSFRKFAAEMIASIAQMSIVQAVFELAQGFAMSALAWFTGNPAYAKSATEHYIAAAVFGGIAGIAVVAGRGLSGNLFQQDKVSAAVGQQQNQATGGSGNQGSAYSSRSDAAVMALGANNPSGREVYKHEFLIKIQSNDHYIADAIEHNVEHRGKIRKIIRKVAAE